MCIGEIRFIYSELGMICVYFPESITKKAEVTSSALKLRLLVSSFTLTSFLLNFIF